MKKKDKYKIIQSYNYGKTIELKPDSKIFIVALALICMIILFFMIPIIYKVIKGY